LLTNLQQENNNEYYNERKENKIKALAKELAKDIKSPDDLSAENP